MVASMIVHLQIFKRPQLPHFSTDLDETGIKTHGLLRSFIFNIVMLRVAVPFKIHLIHWKHVPLFYNTVFILCYEGVGLVGMIHQLVKTMYMYILTL